MEKTSNTKNPVLSDYLFVLYKWKKFLIINLFLIALIVSGLSFLIPNKYKATVTIMIPQSEQMGLGGLSSLIAGKSSIAAMGSKLFGVTNTSEDLLLGILNSRSALTNVIKKFNLVEYYEIKDNNMDKVLKAFRPDIYSNPNEFGMIEFSIINKDPNLSAEIANYLVKLVDSLNIEFNIEQARNNRLFIEKRYLQNIIDLRNAEDSLYKFQKKYGIVAVPEQLEVTVKAAAEIEAMLMKKEIEAYFFKQQFGENSIQYMGVVAEIDLLKNKVQELKNSTDLGLTSNVLFPFKQMPNISIQYLRTFRELEIQQSILELVLPMYEQAKVEEQKSMPTVLVIDQAVPPQLKDSPKRAFLVLGVLFLFSFIFIPFLFVSEKLLNQDVYRNPLQEKFAGYSKMIARTYKIKHS